MTDGPADVAGQVDALYAGPPEVFTLGRAALAKALKAAGDKAAAAEVAGLRKPTTAAWAVNRLVQAGDESVAGALAAAAGVRAAQRRALTGPDAGEGAAGVALRRATGDFRAAVRQAVHAARALIGPAASPSVLDRVAATLQAAATSEAALEAVRSGRLVRDLDPTGLGDVAGLELVGAVPVTRARTRTGSRGGPEAGRGGATPPRDGAESGSREVGAGARAGQRSVDETLAEEGHAETLGDEGAGRDADENADENADDLERLRAEAGLAAAESERLAGLATAKRRAAREAAFQADAASQVAANAAHRAETAERVATEAARRAAKTAADAAEARQRADHAAVAAEAAHAEAASAAETADDAEQEADDARQAAAAARADAEATARRGPRALQ